MIYSIPSPAAASGIPLSLLRLPFSLFSIEGRDFLRGSLSWRSVALTLFSFFDRLGFEDVEGFWLEGIERFFSLP